MINLSHVETFREYFVQPFCCASIYSASSAALVERYSRSKEICKEAAFAFQGASRVFSISRPDEWMERFRIMRFLDRTDLYLTLLRSNRWMNQFVAVRGVWPKKMPFLALTFHYGAGFWVFRHLRLHLNAISAVRSSSKHSEFGDDWVRFRYNQLRNWNLDHEMNSMALVVGADVVRGAVKCLQSGRSFIGLFDVPAERQKNALELPFLGGKARFNRGLVQIAKLAQVPIVVYTMRVDEGGLKRVLSISEPISTLDQGENSIGCEIVSHLERALMTDSTQWHQWGAVNTFFDL